MRMQDQYKGEDGTQKITEICLTSHKGNQHTMQCNIQNERQILEKKGNNYIVPIPTLNPSEIDLTYSLLITHCSFESSISQATLFSLMDV